MKKETKKKIINTSLITTLGIGAMTPIAIALSKNAEANSELNNNIKQSRGISNFTGDLNSSSQFYIADSGNMPDGVKNIKIESFSPNDYRPVPQGFVFRGLGDNGKYYLTCVSKDDPKQVVWYDNYDQSDILQVEYIPREDKLVVLYSLSKKASGTGTKLRIGSYSNASSLTGYAASKLTKFTLSPPQLSGNQRVDMFAFSPVVKANSRTDEVFVYSKTYNGNSNSLKDFMGLYNINNNSFYWFDDSNCGPFPFYYNNAKRYVLSVGVARKDTGTFVFSLLSLIRTDNGQYDIALEMHTLYYNTNSKRWIWEGGDGSSTSKPEWFTYVLGMPRSNIGRYSDSETMEIVRGSISIPSIWSNRTSSNGGQKIAFAHFANTLVPVGGGIHRTPIIAQHVIDMDAWSASARKVGLFDATVDPGFSAELWNGFVLNQTLYAKGYGEYKYTHGSTPFVGMGWKDSVGGLQGGAGIIIKDPTKDTGGLNITSSGNNTNYSRVFAFDQNHGSANISNTQFYSSIWKDTGNQWSSEQQNMGILIPEYYSNEESNPFDINLYGLQNGSRSIEIIDSSGRGAAITNTAKYGYNTVYIDSSERRIDANEPSKRVSTVTADYLNTKYNLNDNSIPSWQNQIIPSLNIRNLRDDTKINFDNRSNKITYNYDKGEVTVDVYGTALYLNGELKYTDDVAKLRNNWWPVHKIGSVTFFGFQPVKNTQLGLNAPKLNAVGNLPATEWMIPFVLSPSNSGVNDSKNNTLFKQMIWRMFASGNTGRVGDPLITNFATEPPSFDANKSGDYGYNEVFFGTGMTNITFDNVAGTITVGKTDIKTKYAFWEGYENETYVDYTSRTWSGFRKIVNTSFVNNAEATVFKNTAWSNKNMPFFGETNNISNETSEGWPNSQQAFDGAKIVSEDEIKTFLFDNYIKTAYDASDGSNSNQWVKGLAYNQKYQFLNGTNPETWTKLTKDNIRLSNFHFYPAKGMFRVDVRLNVWNDSSQSNNGNGGLRWSQSVALNGEQGQEEDGEAPYGRWYIGGFRTDNVTTHLTDPNAIWDMSALVGNISVNTPWLKDATVDPAKATDFFKKVYRFSYENNKITYPFWVNPSAYTFDTTPYTVTNINFETGSITIKFNLNDSLTWFATDDGQVRKGVVQGYGDFGPVTITGFKPVKPLKIDATNIFNISTNLNTDVYIGQTIAATNFNNWLESLKTKIIEYVREEDVKANGDAAQSIEQWKTRLAFEFSLDSENNDLNQSQVYAKILEAITAKPGKLGYLYSTLIAAQDKGIKLRVFVVDNPPADGSAAPLQWTSSNPDQASERWALLDTSKIHTDISLVDWMNEMSAIKGTTINGGSETLNTFDTLSPPSYNGSEAGSGLTYEQIQSILVSIGYKFEYQWIDKTGKTNKSTNKLPSKSSYNPRDPKIDVTISFIGNVPPIYIFDDATHAKTSETFSLNLAVKKLIEIDLDVFNNFTTTRAQNIDISPTGQIGDISSVINAWKEQENVILDAYGENKQYLEIKYSVNNSGFDYTSNTIWTEAMKGWQNAVQNIDQIGKLRFWVQGSYENGTKISAKIVFKRPELAQEFKLDYINGDNGTSDDDQIVVKHGINTTWDMSQIAQQLTATKALVDQGATAENLTGFTPANVMGVTFEVFQQKVREQLGISFQWKAILPSSGLDVEDGWNVNKPTSVDSTLNQVGIRAMAGVDPQYNSNFGLKNFAVGTNNPDSNPPTYTNGVILELALPIYINVDLTKFESINAVLNAKNITITSDGAFADPSEKNDILQAWQQWETELLNSFGENKDRLKVVYGVNGTDLNDSKQGFTLNQVFDQVQAGWATAVTDMSQVGKLRFWSNTFQNGTKIEATIRLTDQVEATGEYKVSLVNDDNGKINVNTGINTTWDLSAYASILEKGMTIVPEGEKQDNISSFTPPAWGNVSFADFESNTKSQLGMKFQWHTSLADGQEWSNNKPTKINPLDNNIWVRLSADKAATDTDSQFNLKGFKDPQATDVMQPGDAAWTSGVKLIVQLPKYIEINLEEKFANIGDSLNDKSITLSATTGNASQGLNEVQQAWQTWEQQMMATFSPEVQDKIEVKYALNDSTFDYSLATLWAEIAKAWQNAVTTPDKLGQLRFWSETFTNGMKIKATFVVKPEFTQGNNSYAISWAGAGKKSEINVNHGIDTVLDLSDYAAQLEGKKIAAGPDSTAQQVNGFTMPGLNGMDFNTFKQAAAQQLGMEFQWAASQPDGSWANWVSNQDLITSVNPGSNQIKFRLKPGAAGLNNNSQFNIANFKTGTTDVDGNNPDTQWSDGVTLTLNLPKYIDVSNAVKAFAQDMAANLVQEGSNTKYIKFQGTVDAKIAELKNKIITDNNLTGVLSAAQIGVEFKFNALGASAASGTTFTEFNSQTTADMISKSNTWNQFTNGVYVRVILLGADSGEANHDDITTSYESDKKEFAIKVQSFQVLDNTYDTHAIGANPILFWTDSVDAKLKTIQVKGKTTNKISLDLAAAGFVEDAGVWYTDDKKNLKLEFSTEALTEDQAGYDNAGANWTTTTPTSLPSTKNLFVRAVPNYPNVVYGPVYDKQAKAVKLDTSAIKPVINVDIKAAASQLVFAGALLAGGDNPSATFTTIATDLEQKAIEKAFENVADKSGKDKVAVKYVLRTSAQDTNTNWITFDQVVEKLNADLKKYNSTNFGIASFIQGQYSLLATIVSTDPEYNIQDSTIQDEDQAVEFAKNGVQLVTNQIETKIDLSVWLKFLQDNKVVVATKAYRQTRAIVDLNQLGKVLQPKAMPGSTASGFFNGRSFNDIVALLRNTFGVEFEFSTNQTDWVQNIGDIQNFDDTVNKLYMQISPSSNNQIKLVKDGANIDAPQTIEMTIQYPRSLVVNQQWLDEFINSNAVSGNTKYLTIEEAREAELVQKILDANPPYQGDPTPNVWVEYRLGTTGKWFKRQAFIDDLAKQTKDQTTNQIQFRLQVDNKTPENEPIYSIDQTERDLTDGTIDANAAVKIFVNPNYEEVAAKVSVKGTNTKFTYNYGSLPVDKANGAWSGANGLKIQWTIDKTATYADPEIDPKWKDAQISEINPADRYLAIRIIALDGYIYSATYNENGLTANADIHPVNTDEIKSEVPVDMETLKQLQFEGYSNAINVDVLKQSEQAILAKVEQGLGDKLAIKYKVTLADGTQLKDTLMSADELQAALQEYATNYNNPSQGLIKFTVDGVQLPGATITATFVSTDPLYTPIDKNGGQAAVEQGMVVPTNNIKTKVDLKAWMEVLKTQPTTFAPGSTNENISDIIPPAMSGAAGSGFLAGMDFKAIEKLLNSVGISIEFQAPGSSTQDNWVTLDQIHDLKNATLNIRFRVADPAIAPTVEIIGLDGQPQDNANPTPIKLVINLPITIVVNMDYLNQLAFEGQTNNLTNFDAIKNKEQQIIENVKTDSKVGADQETADKIDAAQIEIKYYLAGFPGTKNIQSGWMTLDEVKAAIEAANTEKVNFTSNKVQAKFVLLDNPVIDQTTGAKQYQLSVDENASQMINAEQFDDNAPFKVYIHNVKPTDPANIFATYTISGSQENYQIKDFDSWMNAIADLKGLEIEFNSVAVENPNANPADASTQWIPDESAWSTEYNKNPIDNNRNYWVRFKVKPGFIFENQVAGTVYTEPIRLDASQVKVTMKIQSQWLTSIQLTGNLKDLTIDETTALQQAQDQVPQGTDVNVIKIQYTYNGTDWMSKNELIAKLAELKGGPDGSGWIILRESIKARYVLNHEINDQLQPPLDLEIDGTQINNDEESPLIQLINDAEGLNVDVKGYINLDKLTPFIAENFWVTGTSSKAVLHVKDAQAFNNLLDAYKSTGIFEILYKTEKAGQYEPTNKVWNPDGAGIQEQLNINGSLADKYFGIIFRSTSNKYEVYKGDQVQINGYEITSESTPPIKVAVSVEVVNPLIGATVSINFLDGNKQAIYFQNNGAFKLTIVKDGTQYNSFEEFINALPIDGDWNQEMKDSLELAYYVADHELTPNEYTEATKVSNIQPPKGTPVSTDKYNVWKTLPVLNDQTDLGLKVNDYVIVAIRIKDSSLVDPNDPNSSGYIIKDDNHTPTKATRAYGYKIKTEKLDINWAGMSVRNIGAPVNDEKGIDGFAYIDNLDVNVAADVQNYNGTFSLKLNYFDEFYRNAQDEILVSGSGDRLVKRQITAIKGNAPYLDAVGTPIVDKNGNEVYPYYEDSNGINILSKPVTEAVSTRSHELTQIGGDNSNSFRFNTEDTWTENQLMEYALFANQEIKVQFGNKKGLAEAADEYDYYVDIEKEVSYTLQTDKIKFILSNPQGIRYKFNTKEFKEQLKNLPLDQIFENSEDGKGKFKQDFIFNIIKSVQNSQDETLLTTAESMINTIKDDFKGQLKLQTSIRRTGASAFEPPLTAEIGPDGTITGMFESIENLRNEDIIKIEIVPASDDFIFLQKPDPLQFKPERLVVDNSALIDKLKWLRVEQTGEWNGKGGFRVLVDNPYDPSDDGETVESLSENEFEIRLRVWGSDQQMKSNGWITGSSINSIGDGNNNVGLSNGDKIEWAIFSSKGSTTKNPFYNTVSASLDVNQSGKPTYVQINRTGTMAGTSIPTGDPIYGPLPQDANVYPADLGFTIEGLKDTDDQGFTTITDSEFRRLIGELGLSFTGINGYGNMIAKKMPSEIIVNVEGSNTRSQYTLEYLIQKGYIKFYYAKGIEGLSANGWNEFNWNYEKDADGKLLLSPQCLSNGDYIKIEYQDTQTITPYAWTSQEVSGLSVKQTDSMPMIAWVGIGAASVATLGIFAFIYFFARNRKLKNNK